MTKENEVFTYRTGPTADGRFFTWRKYDEYGEMVDESATLYNSEADAEKAARALVDGNDVLAVDKMNSVDKDDNSHVVYETSDPAEVKKFGATIRPIEKEGPRPTSDDQPTPADQAVEKDQVSDIHLPERTEAEQKAVDKVAQKVAAREAKEEGA